MVTSNERIMKSRIIYLSISLLLGFNVAGSNSGDTDSQFPAHTTGENTPADTPDSSKLLIKPFLLEIIPPSSGVQFYRDGIIFLSHAKVDEKVPEKHLSFGTLKTFMTLVQDSVPGKFVPFVVSSDIVFPTEATTFADNFNSMYLSLIPPRSGKEQIFKAVYRTGGWEIEEKPLSFCNDDFIFTHPALSSDGTFMVFSSDLTGTTGGLDLFVVRKEGEKWGKPENLGRQINSPGNELFACLDSRNNLYFSSDGLPGEGGYDIFVCRYAGSGWEKPHNLPDILNTKDDEVAFTVNRNDDRHAFYTSRKKNGKNRCDLFSVTAPTSDSIAGKSGLSTQLLALAGANEAAPVTSAVSADEPRQTVAEEIKADTPTKPAGNIAAADTGAGANPPEPSVAKATQQSPPEPEPKITGVPDKKDDIVYRVQILANTRPVGSMNIQIAGNSYKSYEYLYKGGYRTTVGSFNNLSEAMKLQTICRQNGYKEAFVVAFRNNVRDTDPALFKK
jgi:hypothetical protein